MNTYQLLEKVLAEAAQVSKVDPCDDHDASIYADMRDEFIYIAIAGRVIATRPDGTAFIIGG